MGGEEQMRLCAAGVLLSFMAISHANGQTSYTDVVVIVNVNSSQSVAIGNYYQNARMIPSVNMIYVSADTVEEIDSTQFELLRQQIESHLTTNNLVTSTNYIVTTKGIPLKVNRGNTFSSSSASSSVESDLACILGSYASYIGQNSKITSSYWLQNAQFTRGQYGFYLVTRLDAYTVQHVYDLIDRSGPGLSLPVDARFVFDQDPNWDPILSSLNTNMENASAILVSRGKSVEIDTTTTFLTGRQQVAGYVSWGSNDYNYSAYSQYAIPQNSWAPGSLAETYVSTSGRTFESPAVYGQSLIADMLQEGITGAKGYVYEPFSSAMTNVEVLFDRYTSGNNLAESYYMGSRYLSWMDVIIGDPKTSIDGPSPPLPVQLHYFSTSVTGLIVSLQWGTLSETNNFGFMIQARDTAAQDFVDISGSNVPGNGTTVTPHDYLWLHEGVQPGVYEYRLKQIDFDGTTHYSEAQLVSVDAPTDVVETGMIYSFALEQNYPNPFNPTTTIRYSIPKTERVQLAIYSGLGQEVSRLVDEEQTEGTHQAVVHAGTLASGIYFYRLEVGTNVQIKKMTVIK